jgi:hypothetical protein
MAAAVLAVLAPMAAQAGVGAPEGCILVQGTMPTLHRVNGGDNVSGGTSCTFTVHDNDHFFGTGDWSIAVYKSRHHKHPASTFAHASPAPYSSSAADDAHFTRGAFVVVRLTQGELSVGSGAGT